MLSARGLQSVVVVAALLMAGLTTALADRASSAVSAEPVHGLVVTGTDLGMFPAFAPGIERFAITTGESTSGTATVAVTSSDVNREIRVNGVPDADGTRTVTGLEEGDEIAVSVRDSGGLAHYTLIYLAAGFPMLERVTPDDALAGLAPGHVLLTLGLFTAPSSFYETAVDVNGVPAFVRRTASSVDLQRQPNGSYSVFRPTTAAGRTGFDLVELDERHQTLRTWRTQGLVNTDPHDAILLPDGTAWLMAYEPNATTGLVDSVIQHVEPDGTVLFDWSSASFAEETMIDPGSAFGGDYAHINSFQILPDGHLLASFRHLSSIFKIATHADAGRAPGDVIWKLGGRDSDFDFPDGDVGPCAQHTARMLPNGNVLTFDNGSWTLNSEELCVDQSNPAGPAVDRASTRTVEFALDMTNGSAVPVRTYGPSGRFALFAGSSQALPGGGTMIGWASETDAIATETNAEGELLWELRDPSSGPRYFTYRAQKASVPDSTAPEVTVTTPAAGASYIEGAAVRAAFGCTDRGGSSLRSCTGTVDHGQLLDTTVGAHTYRVSATDGAGGRTTETRSYTVVPAARPDAAIRVRGTPDYRGVGEYGSADAQRVRASIGRTGGKATTFVRLTNDGAVADRLAFDLRGGSRWFTVGGPCADVRSSPVLEPGQSWTCRLVVQRRDITRAGRKVVLRVPVWSLADTTRQDGVSLKVRATRGGT